MALMTGKLRVGVLFGGRSGEHEISLRSAESVLGALDRAKYEVIPVAITKEGRWLSPAEALALLPPSDEIRTTFASGVPLSLRAEPEGKGGPFDVVFPVLHGTFGEDGTVQGFLELAGIAYVGAGVLGSSVGMDKDVMKRLLRDAGLPVVEHWVVREDSIDAFIEAHGGSLPYPVFVKPANLGSSVGIHKVHDVGELGPALEDAGSYDLKIVVERGVPDAREIELAVLGNQDPIVSVAGEVRPSREFYDYQAKYLDDDSELIIPADLTEAQTAEAQRLATATYRALDCSGLGRVDLLLERGPGRFWVNEINTLPGFTSISMYPRLWEASGIPYPELLDRLIGLALDRHARRARLRTSRQIGEDRR
jgi:D-alanine-D-alanine ligase